MSEQTPKCSICGHPMPPGEEMFKFHGYSGNCPVKNDLHILPVGDLRQHDETRECWCHPSVEAVEGGVLVTHHSMDGRELVEKHGAN